MSRRRKPRVPIGKAKLWIYRLSSIDIRRKPKMQNRAKCKQSSNSETNKPKKSEDRLKYTKGNSMKKKKSISSKSGSSRRLLRKNRQFKTLLEIEWKKSELKKTRRSKGLGQILRMFGQTANRAFRRRIAKSSS
jgi:DNA-directed RNA polymerase beta' subunit